MKSAIDLAKAAGIQSPDGYKLTVNHISIDKLERLVQLAREDERKARSQPEQQCNWPTCQSDDYQQALSEQIKRDLVGEQPAQRKPLTDEQVDAEFDAFASKFDHESNEWLDMGVDAYFRAGFKAAHNIKETP